MIGGDNLPSPIQIGLTDLPNIGGVSGPPGPHGSGITVYQGCRKGGLGGFSSLDWRPPSIFSVTNKKNVSFGPSLCFDYICLKKLK